MLNATETPSVPSSGFLSGPSPADLFVGAVEARQDREVADDDDGSETPYWELDSELTAMAVAALAEGDPAREILERATLVAYGDRVILDARYAGLSNSKIWCGRGRRAPFRGMAQITENGYAEISAPAKREVWTQNSSDGFRRSERTQWRVEAVRSWRYHDNEVPRGQYENRAQ